ncbi:MAG: protein-L-isoaspartate(D-aspartate) O-methyltransferase [Verrucomicrobia bacterium]|nr:protein-L-isoaspartate(D-aspartate) O-methyltransferase [Verrucomicrobiota bacterium]
MNTDGSRHSWERDTPDYWRAKMVAEQLRTRNIRDERVLAAFARVPRHLFCPDASMSEAYADHPVEIGCGQTISQPYMVAWMLEVARLHSGDRVLEIGTGSGYQAALLAQLVVQVFSVERIPELLNAARERLARLGAENVTLHCGDGSGGWREHAPFDVIIYAAAAPEVPQQVRGQLAIGGRLLAPVGSLHHQNLLRVERMAEGTYREQELGGCAFVPLRGMFGWKD